MGNGKHGEAGEVAFASVDGSVYSGVDLNPRLRCSGRLRGGRRPLLRGILRRAMDNEEDEEET